VVLNPTLVPVLMLFRVEESAESLGSAGQVTWRNRFAISYVRVELLRGATRAIAKSIVNVTATGERDPLVVKERAVNALGIRRIPAA
jgi:hypothetical protein